MSKARIQEIKEDNLIGGKDPKKKIYPVTVGQAVYVPDIEYTPQGEMSQPIKPLNSVIGKKLEELGIVTPKKVGNNYSVYLVAFKHNTAKLALDNAIDALQNETQGGTEFLTLLQLLQQYGDSWLKIIDINDSLTSTNDEEALSANQGKVLNTRASDIEERLNLLNPTPEVSNVVYTDDKIMVFAQNINAANVTNDELITFSNSSNQIDIVSGVNAAILNIRGYNCTNKLRVEISQPYKFKAIYRGTNDELSNLEWTYLDTEFQAETVNKGIKLIIKYDGEEQNPDDGVLALSYGTDGKEHKNYIIKYKNVVSNIDTRIESMGEGYNAKRIVFDVEKLNEGDTVEYSIDNGKTWIKVNLSSPTVAFTHNGDYTVLSRVKSAIGDASDIKLNRIRV